MGYKKILVAPLDWGLGHATRCIPIIKALEKEKFEPVLAGNGASLQLLRKEFPHLKNFELPSYQIKYAMNPRFLKLKLLAQSPHIIKTISEERRFTRNLVTEEEISGIISDNRWGVFSDIIPSVFITHQLKVLSGWSTNFSSKLQQKLIGNFEEIWIPDVEGETNLSGKLGHLNKSSKSLRYLGILSRFEKEIIPVRFDILAVLSGPEPHRTLLEEKILKELSKLDLRILVVRGVVEKEKIYEMKGNLEVINFATSKELQDMINSSKMVICRSGYSSIMDLVKLQKKAFLVPTPGQPEQECLAQRMQKMGIFPSCSQSDFTAEKLSGTEKFTFSPDLFPASFFVSNGIPAGSFALFQGK